MDEIDFESDDFSDIVSKDPRFSPRAYALLMDCVRYLLDEDAKAKGAESDGEKAEDGEGHASGEEILEEFKCRTLDQYGPLSYRVLSEWGVTSCEDVGEMMMNLAEAKRIGREEGDSPEAFAGGYDFRETFLGPFEA